MDIIVTTVHSVNGQYTYKYKFGISALYYLGKGSLSRIPGR